MAIEGIRVNSERSVSTDLENYFNRGALDVSGKYVDAMVKFAMNVGVVENAKSMRKSIDSDMDKLATLGFTGRPYLDFSPTVVSTSHLHETVEQSRPKGVDSMYIDSDLGEDVVNQAVHAGGDLGIDTNNRPIQAKLRLLLDRSNTIETADIDKSLHGAGLPMDNYARDNWNQGMMTQEELFAQMAKSWNNTKFTEGVLPLRELTLRDFYEITGIDRTREVNPRDQLLASGWSRLLNVPRGGGWASAVNSPGGQLKLSRDYGYAYSIDGFALSTGIK